MNAKQFFIAHGEKVAISATLLLVAVQCYVTFTDTSIRPANINPAEIDAKNTAIDTVFQQGKPPVLKPVPGYLAEMEARFARPIPKTSAASWLTAPPDRGPGSGGLLLYVLELPAPTLSAADTVNSAEITVTLATPARPAGKRLTDAPTATWERTDGVSNHADQVGVLIETHSGDNQWRPLQAKALTKGFITLAKLQELDGKIVASSLEPWTKHTFRARLMAKATGLDLDQPIQAKSTASVVVAQGALIPEGEDPSWSDFTEKVRNKDPKTLARLARPVKDALPGITLDGDEKLYAGADSDVAAVIVTSNVRFALDKVSTDIADPAKDVAIFLATKQFTLKDSSKAWLKSPQSFRAAIGDGIGGLIKTRTPLNPESDQMVDLATPFKVVEIKKQQERVLYWEILTESRPGGKGKDLKLGKKTAQVDVVVVENSKSHKRMELTKLIPVKRPTRKDPIFFPNLTADLDEEAEFRRSPSDFVQAVALPAEPKKYEADAGPLGKLRDEHPDAADLYTTDTPYYELGDGRLVWWEPLNKTIRQYPEPTDLPKPVTPVEAPKPDGKHPVGNQLPPGAVPPGMPPGMIPPGMIPPGSVPKPPHPAK